MAQRDEGHIKDALTEIVEAFYTLLDLLDLPGERAVVDHLRLAKKEIDAIRVPGEKKDKKEPTPPPDEPALPPTQEQGAP